MDRRKEFRKKMLPDGSAHYEALPHNRCMVNACIASLGKQRNELKFDRGRHNAEPELQVAEFEFELLG
ncbi:hypothetical protein AAHA92_14075 [Salvia divinorum]|uniref:Uncharacterized protein n=1 Tax=Salvia divinorum TaxID=28513 RepID=A0ABD1HAC0_SALDI